ncbi:hypothetical protein [Cohnella sp. GCM10012308]|uniref:hypothetical protein n=1 Tax=Cohnella sp. GCM10012308 TaxID=3317329 RepID=UPI00362054A5
MLDTVAAHRYLYQFLKARVNLDQLEQWLYSHEELEEILGKEHYYQFITRDYKSKYANSETQKQIRLLPIKIGFYEQERIIISLTELLEKPEYYFEILDSLYDDYCDGYSFLRYIAMSYASTLDEERIFLKQNHVAMNRYREKLNDEAKRILGFFHNKQLFIEAEHEYIDLRAEKDRIEILRINEMLNDR